MTREEREKAIDLLDNLVGMVEDNQDNNYDFALKKGIEALKQEDVLDKIIDEIMDTGAYEQEVFYSTDNSGDVVLGSALRERIKKLPPVTPIRPKGHWRMVDIDMYACSKCSHVLTINPIDNSILEMNTCPFCSAKMEGVEE